jgi:hypothetical protein
MSPKNLYKLKIQLQFTFKFNVKIKSMIIKIGVKQGIALINLQIYYNNPLVLQPIEGQGLSIYCLSAYRGERSSSQY